MPTVALQNLGCSKNMIDGERIAHLFSAAGYTIVPEFAKADVIVVNTCAFIREAQEEAIEAILESASLKKGGRCRRLIVSGCFSERYREQGNETVSGSRPVGRRSRLGKTSCQAAQSRRIFAFQARTC